MKGEMSNLGLCMGLSKFYMHVRFSCCFGDETLSDDLKSTSVFPNLNRENDNFKPRFSPGMMRTKDTFAILLFQVKMGTW